jgi:NosR/NirI family nitrous oxide reductase transcriptional regulator
MSSATRRSMAVRFFRAGILLAVIVVLRNAGGPSGDSGISLSDARAFFPEATALRQGENLTAVLGAEDAVLGFTVKTLPRSQAIIGYSGPSDVLIALDTEGTVIGTKLLWSGDTAEHADAIRAAPQFFLAFRGWSLGGTNDASGIDAVSGATLTSLAMVESVAVRLGGERPSLRFPESVALSDVTRIFPEAASLEASAAGDTVVRDGSGALVGTVIRTSPSGDAVAGYQGPSDGLIGLRPDGHVQGITLGNTYDNQRYADYVRTDTYFTERLRGKTLDELAALDIDQVWVDGVSGATMTSGAVMEAVIRRVQALRDPPEVSEPAARRLQFRLRDGITTLAIVLACVVAFTRLRARALARLALQIYLVAALGLWAGDMVSLAVLGGWAGGAIPWRSAPGLVALVAAALLLPWSTGRPVYCQQICPHGAAQTLLFRVIPGRLRVPQRLHRIFAILPFLTLLAATAIVAAGLPLSLSALEPFDAWILGVGGLATVIIAITGLGASAFVPQAYCKYGCPTGLVLDYIRARRHEHGLERRDAWAVALLGLATILAWMG